MKSIRLVWKGPLRWFGATGKVVFNQPEAQQPGIYLLTFPHKGGYLIYAAGLTNKSFVSRLFDHTKNYLSGVYNILDTKKATAGKREELWSWIGYGGYSSERWNKLNDFLINYPKLAQQIHAQLQAMRLFIAPLSVNRRELARIEAAIMDILYNGPTIVRALPDPGMQLSRRWPGETPFVVVSVGKTKFYGLPRKFEG